MKYHSGDVLAQLDGTPLNTEEGTPMTLGYILWKSALYTPKDENPSGEQKVWAYNLARRLHDASGFIDLSIEELAYLKRNIGALWSILIVGQVWTILERPSSTDGSAPPR